MSDTAAPLKLLFICTHNRCRSILAEAICNHLGEGLLAAASAGSDPAGSVHPLTLHYLHYHHIPTQDLRSKWWEDMEAFAPHIVVTVCDSAAGESCPLWFGKAERVHWGLADPSAAAAAEDKDEASVEQAFSHTIGILKYRALKLREWVAQGLSPGEIANHMRKLHKGSNHHGTV